MSRIGVRNDKGNLVTRDQHDEQQEHVLHGHRYMLGGNNVGTGPGSAGECRADN